MPVTHDNLSQAVAIPGPARIGSLPPGYFEPEAELSSPRAAHHAARRSPGARNSATALIAGEFLTAVEAIWSGPRVAEYLTATDARRHLWHACLAAEAGAFWPINEDRAEVSYARFASWKGKYLVAQAYGCLPAGIVNALRRLDASARQPGVYRALVSLLSTGGSAAQNVRHCAHLSDDLILRLSAVPARFRSKHLVRALADATGFVDVDYLVWTLARLETVKGPDACNQILSARNPLEATQEARVSFPFPAPPWPASEALQPIHSLESLQEVAAAFDNCLTNKERLNAAAAEVLNGQCYCYQWIGDEAALLRFEPVAPLGWRLREAPGRRNSRLSAVTHAAIAAELARVPMIAPPDWSGDELLEGLE